MCASRIVNASVVLAVVIACKGGAGPGEHVATWGTAVVVDVDWRGAYSPRVAMDAGGNAMAVWYQGGDIWASRHTPGGGWGYPDAINSGSGAAYVPQVAMDPSGNATAVWCQLDGLYTIRANRYTPGTRWGAASPIETVTSGSCGEAQVAMDRSGNAVAVWPQWNGVTDVWANRYTVGAGWGTAELLETDDMGDANDPRVATDAGGNAIAVWSHWNGTRGFFEIRASRYTAGSGWSAPERLDSFDGGDAKFPQIATDGSGNAMVVWHQSGSLDNVWARRHAAASGWGSAQAIETGPYDAGGQRVAADASGNAFAVWHESDGTRENVVAARYTGTGWETPVPIETSDRAASDPAVAMADGSAIAVWAEYDVTGSAFSIWANRYVAGSGWGTAALLETDARPAYSPQVAVSPSGSAVAVWYQGDTAYDVCANQFE